MVSGYLIQMVLGAGGDDVDEWTNILFVVVIAVFWLVGSLLKAKANKAKQEKEEQPEGGRVAAKRPYEKMQRLVARALQAQPQPQIQPAQEKIGRPKPIAQKPAVKRREVQPQAVRAPAVSEIQMEAIGEPIEELEKLKAVPMGLASEETEQPSAAVEEMLEKPLFDFDNVDELRRAILHYEILGKPLSLRKPFN